MIGSFFDPGPARGNTVCAVFVTGNGLIDADGVLKFSFGFQGQRLLVFFFFPGQIPARQFRFDGDDFRAAIRIAGQAVFEHGQSRIVFFRILIHGNRVLQHEIAVRFQIDIVAGGFAAAPAVIVHQLFAVPVIIQHLKGLDSQLVLMKGFRRHHAFAVHGHLGRIGIGPQGFELGGGFGIVLIRQLQFRLGVSFPKDVGGGGAFGQAGTAGKEHHPAKEQAQHALHGEKPPSSYENIGFLSNIP